MALAEPTHRSNLVRFWRWVRHRPGLLSLILATALALVLGYIGFEKLNPALQHPQGQVGGVLDNLYHTLQLFVLEFGNVNGALPWELHLARYLAALAAAYAIIQALVLISYERLRLSWVGLAYRNHIVVCGLGPVGALLVRRYRQERIESAAFVVAELSNSNPNVYLELGYAWGKGKPTILVINDVAKLPFDVRGQRCLIYKNIRDLERILGRELQSLESGSAPNTPGSRHDELNSEVITPKLLKTLRKEYRLNWDGVHGYAHWVRVRENGLRLAEMTGATPMVVELFAFLHDICRRNDGVDSGHGQRAAEFAAELPLVRSLLSNAELDLLRQACAQHTSAQTAADITVQVCWDADRLDLGRIGIHPDPQRLCTAAARQPEIIEWAYRRSLS